MFCRVLLQRAVEEFYGWIELHEFFLLQSLIRKVEHDQSVKSIAVFEGRSERAFETLSDGNDEWKEMIVILEDRLERRSFAACFLFEVFVDHRTGKRVEVGIGDKISHGQDGVLESLDDRFDSFVEFVQRRLVSETAIFEVKGSDE